VILDSASSQLPQSTSLKRRILDTAGWLIMGYGLNLAIRLGSNFLMTRLLVPEMFGVMSMASVVLVGLAMFSDVGLKQCIVRSERGHDSLFLNTAWTVQVLQGTLLWLLAMVVSAFLWLADQMNAFPADTAYAAPVLPAVVAALSSTLLINGLGSTKLHEASRTLRLGRAAQGVIVSQVVGLVCMVAWALVDRSIWALVAGAISSSLVRTWLSHVWLPGRPNRWQWDRAAWREIIWFGKWIFCRQFWDFS
jgi:O-antigen/teichoic acid export membrane protein